MQTAADSKYSRDTVPTVDLKKSNVFRIRLTEGSILRLIVLPLLLVGSSAVLWIVSLPKIDPGQMNDLGLVSVLPFTFFTAVAVLAISYLVTLGQVKTHESILLLHIVLLIFIIHGTPQLVYGTVRYSWAWKHVGIVDYIQRNGTVNPSITALNAYHNWPGFFSLMAFFNTIAGVQSSLAYAGWGPVFFNLLDLAALLVIFKTLSIDRRLAWLAVWFFFLFNWVGQDYFSPQALSYFFFLVTIAVVLRWFRLQKLPFRFETSSFKKERKLSALYHAVANQGALENFNTVQTSGRQRLIVMVAVILNFFVIASSHQLTPLMLISALTALVIFRISNQPFLPILLLVITVDWIVFMAVGFLNGNLYWIVNSIGSLLSNVNGNLINLTIASPGQITIARIDRLLSAAVWILAIFGIVRRFRAGHWDVPAVLLAVSPIPMMLTNSYGGEMLFRVYLFSLPFVSFLAAGLFFPSLKSGASARTSILSVLLSLALIPAFLFSYYGKDRMYYFSPNEVAAAEFVYENAPKGSVIVDGIWDWPRQFTHYEYYNYDSFFQLTSKDLTKALQNPDGTLSAFVSAAAKNNAANFSSPPAGSTTSNPPAVSPSNYPAAYIVITRSQIAEAEMTGVLPPNFFSNLVQAMAKSPNFKVVFSNPDAVVFMYITSGVFK